MTNKKRLITVNKKIYKHKFLIFIDLCAGSVAIFLLNIILIVSITFIVVFEFHYMNISFKLT